MIVCQFLDIKPFSYTFYQEKPLIQLILANVGNPSNDNHFILYFLSHLTN